MSENSDPQLQTMIDNMPAKTGKGLHEWFDVLHAAGLEKHGEMMKLLKGVYGVTHGFANTIVLLYRQQADGGAPAEEDLVAAQYAGAKAGLRPIYDTLLALVNAFGADVSVAPKKSYVSLRRSKQFAIIQPATRTRIDLGLNLKDVTPTERLEGGNVFGGMCTHRVRVESLVDLDSEVEGWLRLAYDQA